MGCGVTQAVVLSLVESFHHKGHHLYMDNLYTSPTLFAILSTSGIGACCTLRTNRKGVPHSIKTSKLSKGDAVTATTEGDMLFLKWKDKREVSLLTTIHDDSRVLKERHSRLVSGGTEEISKPYAITTSLWVELTNKISFYRTMLFSKDCEVVEESVFPSIGYCSCECVYNVHTFTAK